MGKPLGNSRFSGSPRIILGAIFEANWGKESKSDGVFKQNKNAPSSVESRLLGDEFVVEGPGAVILLFRLENKTSVVCHNVYTQKVKIARRDRPHILASNWCETF